MANHGQIKGWNLLILLKLKVSYREMVIIKRNRPYIILLKWWSYKTGKENFSEIPKDFSNTSDIRTAAEGFVYYGYFQRHTPKSRKHLKQRTFWARRYTNLMYNPIDSLVWTLQI